MKIIFAVVAALSSFVVYIPYYRGLWKKETKPHVLTWITWTIETALGCALSYFGGGGFGAFIFGVHSVLCCTIALYALFNTEKNIVRWDWFTFICSIIIAIFYILTKNASVSVVLVVTIDCLAYIPTFRKSYQEPFQEPVTTYLIALFSWLFSIGALETYSFVTMLYPLTLVLINLLFILFLLFRRKMLPRYYGN